jgi:hypothetical protein
MAADTPGKKHRSRVPTQQRKAELEATIEQQRLMLLEATREWHQAGQKIDHGVTRLIPFRTPLLIAGGIALLPLLRRPGHIVRIARKAATTAFIANRALRLFRTR